MAVDRAPTRPLDTHKERLNADLLEFISAWDRNGRSVRKIKQETDMKMTAGLWIDHRKAVIVIISAEGERTLEIRSKVEKQPGRIDGVRSTTPYEAQMVKADDSREREFMGQLSGYYEEVMAPVRDAESLLIFGPGEAKGELKKHLEHAKFRGKIIGPETVDKMTDAEIAAKVRGYFS